MNLNELENYFKGIATSHVDIDGFVWGDAFEQIQDLLNDLSGVVLMVDSPDFRQMNHGFTGRSVVYDSELVVLKLTDKQDKARKQNDLIETMDIINEVIRKIEYDMQIDDIFEFSLVSKLTQTFLDNRIGWRVSFTLSFDIDVNKDESKWL